MKAELYTGECGGRLFLRGLCLLLLSPAAVFAFEDEPTGWNPDYVEEAQAPWQEMEGELPAYPEKDNLLEVAAGSEAVQYTIYLDEPSLVKNEDGVVRYTVVLVSSSGVWNVTNEGLHCGEKMFRRYAYGVDGKWQPLADSAWRPLRGKGANRYRVVFYKKYICDPTRLQQSARQILDRFREGWHEQM